MLSSGRKKVNNHGQEIGGKRLGGYALLLIDIKVCYEVNVMGIMWYWQRNK